MADGPQVEEQQVDEQQEAGGAPSPPHAKNFVGESPQSGFVPNKASVDFLDPTRDLPSAMPEVLLDFPDDVVARWQRRLADLPLLIFSCMDQRVRYSVVYALQAMRPELGAREIWFGTFSHREHHLTMRMFNHTRFAGGTPSLVCVWADQQDAVDFLQEMPNSTHSYIRWRETLRFGHRVVVITTPERVIPTGAALLDSPVYMESVDFIAPRIRSAYPDRWRTITDDVRRQHARGLWGSDEVLLQWLCTLGTGTLGTPAFEERYEACKRAMDEADPKTALVRISSEKAARTRVVLDDNTPIEAAVLFTGAFFQGLTVPDYLQTVSALLGERPALEQPAAGAPGPDGREPPPPPRVLLSDQWQRGMRGFIKTCHLRTISTQPPTLDFESPDVREATRKQFESEDFVDYHLLCERVAAAGLIAHESASIREGAVTLVAKRMIADKLGYGANCLPHLIGPLLSSPSPDPLEFALASPPQVERIVSAIVSLFTHLLDRGALDLVVSLVKMMMERHCHAELLPILSRLAHPTFAADRFVFYRRLIDEGTNETRGSVHGTFFRTLSSGDRRATTVLKALRGWADGSAAPHAERATALLRDLITGTIASERAPFAHPIASMLTSVPLEEARALLDWIAEQPTDDLLEPLQEIERGKILCLSYLWILPRPMPQRAFDPTHSTWPFIQAAWLGTLQHGVNLGLRHVMKEPFADTFAALALADYAVALAQSDLDLDDEARAAYHAQIAASVIAMPSRKRAVRVQWRAMEQAFGACLTTLPETGAADDRELFDSLRNHWRKMRSTLKSLLNECSPSHEG